MKKPTRPRALLPVVAAIAAVAVVAGVAVVAVRILRGPPGPSDKARLEMLAADPLLDVAAPSGNQEYPIVTSPAKDPVLGVGGTPYVSAGTAWREPGPPRDSVRRHVDFLTDTANGWSDLGASCWDGDQPRVVVGATREEDGLEIAASVSAKTNADGTVTVAVLITTPARGEESTLEKPWSWDLSCLRD